MQSKISVVINTFNEEDNIKRAIQSVGWADEVIVCDMYSEDQTVEEAKKLGAKVVYYKKQDYVELARNFAVSKALNEWVLVIDPDEEIPQSLAKRLQEIAGSMKQIEYVRIPRKNIIFNKWVQTAMWWPDLNIRFFRKGKVQWGDKIHVPPKVSGQGLDLPADEQWAITHYHYDSVVQFLERMIRYTKIQSEELVKEGYKFNWQDLITKPLSEFLSRFFANQGYKDGLHGLILSLLQAFSFLIVYLKIWEKEGFKKQDLDLKKLQQLSKQSADEINYWFKFSSLSGNSFKRFFQKIKGKL